VNVTNVARLGTLLVSVHPAEEEEVREGDLVVDAAVDAQVDLEAAAATTVVNQVTCLVTAQSREWEVAVVAAVEVTVRATIAERVVTCPVTVLTEWAEEAVAAVALMDASVTTVMRLDICRVTAQMLTDDHLIGAVLNASGATRWVTLHVTVPTAAVVVVLVHAVDVAAAAARTCVATTATRSDTSRATVPQLRRALLSCRPVGGLGWLLSNSSRATLPTYVRRSGHVVLSLGRQYSQHVHPSPCISLCPECLQYRGQ
jgi:hypothetical protein